MSEAVSFWMDNKSCVGKVALTIGDLSLVIYRERYYLLKDGTAEVKGGKPVRYSLSSLPAPWKLALKGAQPVVLEAPLTAPATEPVIIAPKRPRKIKEPPIMPEEHRETEPVKVETAPVKVVKPAKKVEKPAALDPVLANCPYCSHRHEIPVEKGKSGKAFFVACAKCTNEFAVRFVQVTVFQAQVAGFK